MPVLSAEAPNHELTNRFLARRLRIFVARDPGVDRRNLSWAEGDAERYPGFRVRHIHKLMPGDAPVKRISPSVRRRPAAKPVS